jgi:hypothetical protein
LWLEEELRTEYATAEGQEVTVANTRPHGHTTSDSFDGWDIYGLWSSTGYTLSHIRFSRHRSEYHRLRFRLVKISPVSASSACGRSLPETWVSYYIWKVCVVSRFLCFSGGGRYSLLAKKRDIRAYALQCKKDREDEWFCEGEMEIIEDMRTRTGPVSYILLQNNSTHSPMK